MQVSRLDAGLVNLAAVIKKDLGIDPESLPGGMTAIFSICRKPLTLTESMTDAVALLTDTAEQVIHLFDAGNALRHRSP